MDQFFRLEPGEPPCRPPTRASSCQACPPMGSDGPRGGTAPAFAQTIGRESRGHGLESPGGRPARGAPRPRRAEPRFARDARRLADALLRLRGPLPLSGVWATGEVTMIEPPLNASNPRPNRSSSTPARCGSASSTPNAATVFPVARHRPLYHPCGRAYEEWLHLAIPFNRRAVATLQHNSSAPPPALCCRPDPAEQASVYLSAKRTTTNLLWICVTVCPTQ